MKIEYLEDLKDVTFAGERYVTIGIFDGVHLGHQRLLQELEKSDTNKLKTIITFDYPLMKRPILNINDKVELLSSFAVDEIIIIRFTKLIQGLHSTDFIEFLKRINVQKIYVGKDFKYGFNLEGVLELETEFVVQTVDFLMDDKHKISSSIIREKLEKGEVEKVRQFLGRPYSLSGYVIKGDQIGKTIDFPTANIQFDISILRNGVYKTNVYVKGKQYKAVTNVGNRPTIFGKEFRIESHILNFSENIYGEKIKIEFLEYIRPEIRFENLEALKKQIKLDIKNIDSEE